MKTVMYIDATDYPLIRIIKKIGIDKWKIWTFTEENYKKKKEVRI